MWTLEIIPSHLPHVFLSLCPLSLPLHGDTLPTVYPIPSQYSSQWNQWKWSYDKPFIWFWILIPALLSDAIALIKGMGKGDFRVGHARDVPTLVRWIVFLHLPTSLPMGNAPLQCRWCCSITWRVGVWKTFLAIFPCEMLSPLYPNGLMSAHQLKILLPMHVESDVAIGANNYTVLALFIR